MILIVALVRRQRRTTTSSSPQNEFKLDPWLALPGPLDLNKGVLYLLIATALTLGTCSTSPSACRRARTACRPPSSGVYTGMRDKIVRDNMDDAMATKWFPLVFTLFVFIWISNLIGYLPLPVNTEHKVDVFGTDDPVVPDLRRDGQRLDPARAGARSSSSPSTSRASARRASGATRRA